MHDDAKPLELRARLCASQTFFNIVSFVIFIRIKCVSFVSVCCCCVTCMLYFVCCILSPLCLFLYIHTHTHTHTRIYISLVIVELKSSSIFICPHFVIIIRWIWAFFAFSPFLYRLEYCLVNVYISEHHIYINIDNSIKLKRYWRGTCRTLLINR